MYRIQAWDPSNAIALMEYTAKLGFEVGGFEVGNEKEHVLTPADYAGCMKTMSVVFFLLFSFYFPNFLLLARALSCTLRSCYYFDVCEDHVRGLSPSLFPYFGPCTFTLSLLLLLQYFVRSFDLAIITLPPW